MIYYLNKDISYHDHLLVDTIAVGVETIGLVGISEVEEMTH